MKSEVPEPDSRLRKECRICSSAETLIPNHVYKSFNLFKIHIIPILSIYNSIDSILPNFLADFKEHKNRTETVV